MTTADTDAGAIACPVCDKAPTAPGPEVVHDEPLTHCEWCGAEYPEPDEAPPPAAA